MRVLLATILALLVIPGPASAQEEVPSLIRLSAVRDSYPSWSPDGLRIVFESDRHSGVRGARDIYIMNADGSGLRQVLHREERDETPVWSPDGELILFSSYVEGDNNELFTMRPDGSDLRRLTDHPGRDGHPQFSPDGRRIIFNAMRDDDGESEIRNYEIYQMNLDGTDLQRLTEFPEWDTYPSISPDGTKVLWRRVLPTGGSGSSGRNSEIFVMNRDGSGVTNLSRHPDFDGYPSWSPDGRHVVFASNREGQTQGNFHLYLMDDDGGNVVKLLENGPEVEDARPQWSPDGQRILFNRQEVANQSGIEILTLDLSEMELSVD